MATFADELIQWKDTAERRIESQLRTVDGIVDHNQWKVIEAFQRHQVSDFHFAGSTGYACKTRRIERASCRERV